MQKSRNGECPEEEEEGRLGSQHGGWLRAWGNPRTGGHYCLKRGTCKLRSKVLEQGREGGMWTGIEGLPSVAHGPFVMASEGTEEVGGLSCGKLAAAPFDPCAIPLESRAHELGSCVGVF